jgi:hypothetical protein
MQLLRFALSPHIQHLVSSSQSPAYINQCRGGADVRKRPRHGNVANVRWIVYHQLCDNVEAKQVYHLSIRGRDDLRECSCKGKSYISLARLSQTIGKLRQLGLTYLGSSPSKRNARFAASVGVHLGCRYASSDGRCQDLLHGPWLARLLRQRQMRRKSRRGRELRARGWRGRRLWLWSGRSMLAIVTCRVHVYVPCVEITKTI